MQPKVYTVDLGAPLARWSPVNADFRSNMGGVIEYFEEIVPKWALPLIERVASSLTSYFHVYGEEMEAMPKASISARASL